MQLRKTKKQGWGLWKEGGGRRCGGRPGVGHLPQKSCPYSLSFNSHHWRPTAVAINPQVQQTLPRSENTKGIYFASQTHTNRLHASDHHRLRKRTTLRVDSVLFPKDRSITIQIWNDCLPAFLHSVSHDLQWVCGLRRGHPGPRYCPCTAHRCQYSAAAILCETGCRGGRGGGSRAKTPACPERKKGSVSE